MNKNIWLLLVIVVSLSACSSNPTPTIQPTAIAGTAYPMFVTVQPSAGYPGPMAGTFSQIDPKSIKTTIEAPVPESGKASISGVLFSKGSSTILSNFLIYLTPGFGSEKNKVPPVLVGPLTDKGDVSTRTDKQGNFEFNNLIPGNYYLIIDLSNDYSIAQISLTDDKPLMLMLKENTRNSLGLVIAP